MTEERSLEAQRQEFSERRFLAVPLDAAIVWTIVGFGGAWLSPIGAVWTLFIGTGSIIYLGLFVSKFTGEDLLDKSKPKNTFDRLFILTMAQALLVFSIAIPFFLVDHTSLPMTVGILTGLMWLPLSWTLQHWVGIFHGVSRTALVLAAWYAFPDHRFVVIPAIIVAIYAVTIFVLERRWRALETA